MDKIIWNECFSVGVEELDRQHQELIRMTNQLIDAGDVAVNSETISHLLTEMTQYAGYHFKTEEQYMIDDGSSEYVAHKKQHNEFMEQTHSFCLDTMRHKAAVPTEILSFLKAWLTNHILNVDMQFKSRFEEKARNLKKLIEP